MNYLIKDLPNDEKPRERLLKYGIESLSNNELISIVLRCGTKNSSVKNLSNEILHKFSSVQNLKDITINNLTNIKGIGIVKAITLIASIELGKRVYYEKEVENTIIKKTEDIYNYMEMKVKFNKQEKFYVILLDTKNRIISYKLLFMGTIDFTTVHPREILKYAINNLATSIILIHNHPSGDPNPSNNDIEFTSTFSKASKLIGINFLDHVIIGHNKYYSFYEMIKNK